TDVGGKGRSPSAASPLVATTLRPVSCPAGPLPVLALRGIWCPNRPSPSRSLGLRHVRTRDTLRGVHMNHALVDVVERIRDGLRGPASVAPVPDLAVVADARQHDMDVIVAVADRDPRPIPHVHLVHEPRSGVGPLAIIHLPVTRRGA